MEIDTQKPKLKFIAQVKDPKFENRGTLYFLEADYLFRYKDERGNMVSKFVTVTDLAAAFSHTEQDTGWLAAGVVRTGSNARGEWFVYSAPAQKVSIPISETEVITIPIPRTVMLGVGNTYYLWALACKYFNPEERAFLAPFPNIHEDGHICWGQNTPGQASSKKARQVWDLFFQSAFNGDLANKKSRAFPEDVRKQLRGLVLAEVRTYPINDLVVSNRTIGATIDSILGR